MDIVQCSMLIIHIIHIHIIHRFILNTFLSRFLYFSLYLLLKIIQCIS